jgi:hypothetical protein
MVSGGFALAIHRFNSACFIALALLIPSASLASQAGEVVLPLAQVMRPGITFRDLVYPIASPDSNGRQILYAARAEIRQTAHLLDITGLRLSEIRQNGGFELDAAAAEYDLSARTLCTRGDFRASGSGAHCEGTELVGSLESRLFELRGRFKIYSEPAIPAPFWLGSPPKITRSPFLAPFFQPIQSVSAEVMTPFRLVRDFAGDLETFFDCWGCIEAADPAHSPAITLMGRQGGEIDFRQMKMKFAGPSAILGPRSVLVCSGGMDARQEVENEGKPMRLVGQGGICAWMASPKSQETWIRSGSFEYVSDRRVFEFTGGPLLIGRNGMILQATETWQFVRVFNGQRIILSPGHWNTMGNLISPAD